MSENYRDVLTEFDYDNPYEKCGAMASEIVCLRAQNEDIKQQRNSLQDIIDGIVAAYPQLEESVYKILTEKTGG